MAKIDREVQDPIVARVAHKIIDRSDVGLNKYGTNLTRGDLTNEEWLNHLQDELLDGANYVEVLKTKLQIAKKILESGESNFEKVKQWCEDFEASKKPYLWMSLVVEEFKETLEAFGLKNIQVTYDANVATEMDKVALLDGICDLLWVTYGLGHSFRWNVDEAFEEVNRSNQSKKWPDGTVHKREDGKILKGPNFSEPRLKKFVDEGDKERFGDITGFQK